MNRAAALLTSLFLLAACSSGQHTTRLLNDRMQARLAPEIAAGRAVVQPLPDGTRVTLLDSSLFPNSAKALDNTYPDVRANVLEGLLDPSLMRVQVADTSTLPPYQQDTRIRNVEDYFTANLLGIVLVPGQPIPPGVAPAGLNITVSVQCPPRNSRTVYGDDDGRSTPVCE